MQGFFASLRMTALRMLGFSAEFTLSDAEGLRMTALRMLGFSAEFTLSDAEGLRMTAGSPFCQARGAERVWPRARPVPMLFIGSPGAVDPRAIASPSPADAGEGGKGGEGALVNPSREAGPWAIFWRPCRGFSQAASSRGSIG
jgi:hypothetical protein